MSSTVVARVDVVRAFPDNPARIVIGGVVLVERPRWDWVVLLNPTVQVVSGGFNRRGGGPGRPRLAAIPGTVLLVGGVLAEHPDLTRDGVGWWPQPATPPTLFARLGVTRVEALAAEFVTRVLDDDRMIRYMIHVDVDGLRRHVVFLLTSVLGGPQPYNRTAMLWQVWRRRYAQLGLTGVSYDRLRDHLSAALTVVGADTETATFLLGRMTAARGRFVTNRSTPQLTNPGGLP